MKIVHVVDYFEPQVGYQESFLTKEQIKLGHDVYVVTSDRCSPGIAKMGIGGGKAAKRNGFFVEEGIKIWRLKVLFEVYRELWMIGLGDKIQELKPDVVHVAGATTLTAIRVARLRKKFPNTKFIFTDTMSSAGGSFRRLRTDVMYPIFRYTFSGLVRKAADVLVAGSDDTKSLMSRKCGFPPERIEVISLGADDTIFRYSPEARDEVRANLGIDNGRIVFIYTGKIVPSKGVHLLIEATKSLTKKYGNVTVLLVGAGPPAYINEMKEKIKSAGLEENFIWHETVPNKELYKFYSAANIAVWPCSVTIGTLEAMACGLPVIVSNIPAATERVQYNNGLVCNNGSISELPEQMEKLIVDRELRINMGRNGRKAIEENLNWRSIAKRYLELYCQDSK